MGNLGDSISAAALANTAAAAPLSLFPTLFNIFELRAIFSDGLKWGVIDNKRRLSWASGSDHQSHYIRLRDHYKKDQGGKINLTVANVAVSGSVAEDLPPQADKLVKFIESGEYEALPYVTLMIGANDVCDDISPDRVYSQIMDVLGRLNQIRQEEKVHVLVSSIPRIHDLGRPAIRDHRTGNGYRCSFIREKVMRYCNSITEWNGTAEYQAKAAKIDEMNRAIQAAVAEASKTYVNLQVQYSPSLHDYDLTFDVLAADCFHPNQHGHELISEKLWKDQPWF